METEAQRQARLRRERAQHNGSFELPDDETPSSPDSSDGGDCGDGGD